MFTGIITHLGTVASISGTEEEKQSGLIQIWLT